MPCKESAGLFSHRGDLLRPSQVTHRSREVFAVLVPMRKHCLGMLQLLLIVVYQEYLVTFLKRHLLNPRPMPLPAPDIKYERAGMAWKCGCIRDQSNTGDVYESSNKVTLAFRLI